MKILISPAKLMNIDHKTDMLKASTPKFIEEAAHIQKYLKEKDPKFIKELMHISDKLANENWERNQKWMTKPTAKNSTSALFAFAGEVYRGLDVKTLDKPAVDFLQKNLRMLSGLYGLLKPSDKVMLYRLEMGCGFSFESYKNLYSFWTEKVTEELNSQLKAKDFVLNLASNEYSKAVDKKKLKAPVIEFDFYEEKEGKHKTIVVYTKHARGLVARFCAQNNIEKLNDVKAFNLEGYLFNDALSTEHRFIFTR
ncbi:peroxide stress protein YaaA [Elizabethkingia meningoseptica]|uniref:peroxide stress protein YaaA n=1 Tax=Elizabethkingia meningoseptica TaxID=238 RepID=UPI002DD68A51|nr:peroxide stress protein YaaA [Elizabethkingia meningoseptica]MEC4711607.1 peroxide stress protein YaaA [Elizabethkingia meningoseptica]